MNYEEMSDFEINRMVAKSLGIQVSEKLNPWLWKTDFCLHQLNGDGSKIEKTIVANYCNDPSDAWSIIVENGICITSPTTGRKRKAWSASWNEDGGRWSCGDITHGDDNPLRAAMICFLKMKDAENDI